MSQKDDIQDAIYSIDGMNCALSKRTKVRKLILKERIRDIELFDCIFSGNHYTHVSDKEVDDFINEYMDN